MTNKSRVKIIIIFLFLAGLSIALYLRRPKSSWDSGWGKGLASNSERTFYYHRIRRIREDWQETKRKAERDDDGRLKDSYNTYLVIDLDKKAIWVEENGQVRTDEYSELPPETKWSLYHYTPEGQSELKGRNVFKIRGVNTAQNYSEQFWLVGLGTRGHIAFNFGSSSGGGSLGTGSFNKPSFAFPSSTTDDNSYGSILVNEEEYRQYRDSLPETSTLVAEDENKIAWNRIEKSLYLEIKRQFARAGFDRISSISVRPGADFSAAHAEIRARNNSIVSQLLGKKTTIDEYFKIDYIGNDTWYAKSVPNSEQPSMIKKGPTLNFEFLVNPELEVADSLKTELLKKGREIQQSNSIFESKWKVTLANGMKIELLGICENPSARKQWWGPDGSPVDYIPYMNIQPYENSREDRKIYEFAWRTTPNLQGSGLSVEGRSGAYNHTVYDRYGNRISDNMHAEGFGFDKSKRNTTFKFAFKTNNNNEQTVIFKNISLVPGENQGFEIEVIEPEEK